MAATALDDTTRTMIGNLPEKTGRSLEQWIKELEKTSHGKHGEIVKHLKGEFGVTHGFANLIAHLYRDAAAGGPADGGDLVDAQYKGPKAGLRPICDAVIEMVSGFGEDVEISPKKTYVSLRRGKQFALVQPSTKDRVDVGINLKGEAPGKRLEESGSFNAMVSHRVRITDRNDVNAQLRGWLRKAYDRA